MSEETRKEIQEILNKRPGPSPKTTRFLAICGGKKLFLVCLGDGPEEGNFIRPRADEPWVCVDGIAVAPSQKVMVGDVVIEPGMVRLDNPAKTDRFIKKKRN